MWSRRFCSWSLTFHHLYLSSQYPIFKPPSLYWWHTIFFCFYAPDCPSNISYLFNDLAYNTSPPGWLQISSHSTLLKTEFLLIGLKQQLAKIQNCTLNTTHSAHNLGFIFDEHLTFSDQICALSKSCYSHIRELRCIRPYLYFKTANTITTSIVHSELDYCNSLYYNLTLFSVKQTSTNPELSCSCCC